jgi:hypothetical protein
MMKAWFFERSLNIQFENDLSECLFDEVPILSHEIVADVK